MNNTTYFFNISDVFSTPQTIQTCDYLHTYSLLLNHLQTQISLLFVAGMLIILLNRAWLMYKIDTDTYTLWLYRINIIVVVVSAFMFSSLIGI